MVDCADDIVPGQVSIFEGKPYCPYFATELQVNYI